MSWKKDDEVTITFESLKNAQNEAFQDGIAFAITKLKNRGLADLAEELEIETMGVALYIVKAE
jgi:hypothetical protein